MRHLATTHQRYQAPIAPEFDRTDIERAASAVLGLADPGLIYVGLRQAGLSVATIAANLANIMEAAQRQGRLQ